MPEIVIQSIKQWQSLPYAYDVCTFGNIYSPYSIYIIYLPFNFLSCCFSIFLFLSLIFTFSFSFHSLFLFVYLAFSFSYSFSLSLYLLNFFSFSFSFSLSPSLSLSPSFFFSFTSNLYLNNTLNWYKRSDVSTFTYNTDVIIAILTNLPFFIQQK